MGRGTYGSAGIEGEVGNDCSFEESVWVVKERWRVKGKRNKSRGGVAMLRLYNMRGRYAVGYEIDREGERREKRRAMLNAEKRERESIRKVQSSCTSVERERKGKREK